MKKIFLTYGIGEGPTQKAAFDKALYDSGISNYNHIMLSSVIPPDSEIIVGKIGWNDRKYGDRLYSVMSKYLQSSPGKEAWAGLGWVQDETLQGLFVEEHGKSETEVINRINKSLKSMQSYRREKFGDINNKTIGIKCIKHPACAIVCAVYEVQGWGEITEL